MYRMQCNVMLHNIMSVLLNTLRSVCQFVSVHRSGVILCLGQFLVRQTQNPDCPLQYLRSHPLFEKPLCCILHLSHCRPSTPSLQGHCPLTWPQTVLLDPVLLHAHSIKDETSVKTTDLLHSILPHTGVFEKVHPYLIIYIHVYAYIYWLFINRLWRLGGGKTEGKYFPV